MFCRLPVAIAVVLSVQCNLPLHAQVDSTTPANSAESVDSTPVVFGESFQINSSVMGSPREINIRVPARYDLNENPYPVLYVIDGGLEQDFHHIAGLAQLATINANYEELIVVGIKTENRLMELTDQPTDPRYVTNPPRAGKSGQFLKHIADEVIPFVEKRYRTGPRRAVIGESLAGLFIVEVFLKHPATFTDYISISPSLWWDDKALAKASSELLTQHDDQPRHLYLTMADEGGTMQGGLDMVMESIRENKPDGLDWQYVDRRDSETHGTIYHGAAHDALRKLFDIPAPEITDVPWYLIEGGQPPETDEPGQ